MLLWDDFEKFHSNGWHGAAGAGDSEPVTRGITRTGIEPASEAHVSGEATNDNVRDKVDAAVASQGVHRGWEPSLPCLSGWSGLIQRRHLLQP
jgi:hypothetical protein